MEYDFDTKKGAMSSNYFSISNCDECINNDQIKQIKISFNHSIYGNMTAIMEHYRNPQLYSGVSIKYNTHDEATKNLTGLLVREYKCKSMECRKLRKTKPLKGKIGKNKVTGKLA